MSDFRPDYMTLRPWPPAGTPGRLRRTQSHTPGSFSANQRATTHFNTVYTNKNRPKDGLLPSPRIDFNRMYSSIRLPVTSCDMERSRSPSPASPIHFTPIPHPHDMSLPVKRDSASATPCGTANSVPSKAFSPLMFPSNLNYPFVCGLVPTVHPLSLTAPCPAETQTRPHSTVMDLSSRLTYSDKVLSHKRLSKSLMPEFRDGSYSPEPTPEDLKRGYRTQSAGDSDYESCSSGSNTGHLSPVDTQREIDSYAPSVASGSERSSGCSSPSVESDSDSALNAPTRVKESNRSLGYKIDSEHFFSSSSSSSPEPGEYPTEDILFIDNNKLPNTPRRSSPATTPCSSHVCQLPGTQLTRSLQKHSTSVTSSPFPNYSKSTYSPQDTSRHSYSHPHNNGYRHNNVHQKRRQTVNHREMHSRAYNYGYYPQTESSFFNLSADIWKNCMECKQEDSVYISKYNYCQRLTASIEEVLEGVQFCMVGSSMNGFSTSDCDLDLCMMTPNHPTPTRQDAVERLCEVSNRLREKKIGQNHQVISAKTPIIKYSDPHSGFEVDISVNNQHGIRNTNLLRMYSQLDQRVRPLVVFIKQWAKKQEICNARVGTLSSYSLTLMVIFYLQYGCSPAVLPSLQEIYPEYFDNWEIYPPEQLDRTQIKWSSGNGQNLAELLVGFFKFFSEFNYQNVMSIRTASIIPASYDQLGYIRIEEPYTRENVAHSVSRPWCFTAIKSRIQNAYIALCSSDISTLDALYNNRPVATIPSSFAQNYY